MFEERELSWAHWRVLVETTMNIPLIFESGDDTGIPWFAKLATNHTDYVREYFVRDDGSTYHT